MIHEAQERLCEKGFEQPEPLIDPHGTIGYLLRREGKLYVLVAKAYAYQELASFIEPVVNQADNDVGFIFYSENDDTYTVFDARFLKENGSPSQGPSKKRECKWVEISLEFGAELNEYLAGRESPRTIAGDNQSLAAFN